MNDLDLIDSASNTDSEEMAPLFSLSLEDRVDVLQMINTLRTIPTSPYTVSDAPIDTHDFSFTLASPEQPTQLVVAVIAMSKKVSS